MATDQKDDDVPPSLWLQTKMTTTAPVANWFLAMQVLFLICIPKIKHSGERQKSEGKFNSNPKMRKTMAFLNMVLSPSVDGGVKLSINPQCLQFTDYLCFVIETERTS